MFLLRFTRVSVCSLAFKSEKRYHIEHYLNYRSYLNV